MSPRIAIILGAGPAGLTAAYELATRTDIQPIIVEPENFIGGLSRTVNYGGNRMDIGGHRFFSKSDRVMRWWFKLLPLQRLDGSQLQVRYQQQSREWQIEADGPDPELCDEVMLVRPRKSRIYFERKFFDYPLSLSTVTIANLGLLRTAHLGLSYLSARLRPLRPENTLEEFLVNRFGRRLYETFFESYTEKVWGLPCEKISAEWGAQRIKGLSISKALASAAQKLWKRNGSLAQKDVETSLIEQFFYPKFGPGQIWETCARQVTERGGQLLLEHEVEQFHFQDDRIARVNIRNKATGELREYEPEFVFSSAPVQWLVDKCDAVAPAHVREVARNLIYRDFITVGLLVKRTKLGDQTSRQGPLTDNWIYIQEPEVKLGRLQIFNNWSPYMVAQPDTTWLGLEYFCNEGDDLWNLPADDMRQLGIRELVQIGVIDERDVLDGTVIKVPKAYPAYFGGYERFAEIRAWTDQIENLFLIGRNGMHRYNNQDHSMLTAMLAVDNILAGVRDKANLWNVNAEQEYHETSKSPAASSA